MTGSGSSDRSIRRTPPEWGGLAGAAAAVAAVVVAYTRLLHLTNPTIVALSFLLIVFGVAMQSTTRVALAASVVAAACFNFFFLPPTGRWTIEEAQNWFALFTFIVTSVFVSRLSSQARSRAREAEARSDDLARLLIERQRLLDDRREADVARRSAELRSTLLASLSHDLRTPLTAVTVASNNLDAAGLSDADRREQLEVVRIELARLNRLFDHVVDMARIDIDAVTSELEWVDPESIIDAARHQVARVLTGHPLDISVTDALAVKVDPRLTAAALAHVLENAGQYSPAGAPIAIQTRIQDGAMIIRVRDRGPGLTAGELTRVFDRSYRGEAGRHRFGTGMGLAIARGLLAAEGGRISAANAPDGGACFSLAVPCEVRAVTGDPEDHG